VTRDCITATDPKWLHFDMLKEWIIYLINKRIAVIFKWFTCAIAAGAVRVFIINTLLSCMYCNLSNIIILLFPAPPKLITHHNVRYELPVFIVLLFLSTWQRFLNWRLCRRCLN